MYSANYTAGYRAGAYVTGGGALNAAMKKTSFVLGIVVL